MHRARFVFLLCLGSLLAAAPASAQRLSFERVFAAAGAMSLDIETLNGEVEVIGDRVDRITVSGTVTVRFGWNVPANALELANTVMLDPPVTREGTTIRLRRPARPEEQRAVSVAYRVRVPLDTTVSTLTRSGATSISGVAGRVSVRTHSSAIRLERLAGETTVHTQSGAVDVIDTAGAVAVTTGSSAFTGRALRGALRVLTSSGAVDAQMRGDGDVAVETGSSAIDLRGVTGGLQVRTRSGHIEVSGRPTRSWEAVTGSSEIDLEIEGAPFTLDAHTRSGTVQVHDDGLSGTASKHEAKGTIGGGGPLVHATSRSGNIEIRVGASRQE